MTEESEAFKKGRDKLREAKNLCQFSPDSCNRIVAKELCGQESNKTACITGAFQQSMDEKKCEQKCRK